MTPTPNTRSSSLELATVARHQIGPRRKRGARAAVVATAVTVVAIYLRISEDAEAKGLGVARQRQDAIALARRLFGAAVKILEFVDNDITGGDFTARAGYDDMLEGLAAGRFKVIAAYDLDRITREGLEAEEFYLITEMWPARVVTCAGNDLEPGAEESDMAMLQARMSSAVAIVERAKTRRRVRRKHAELAEAGKVSGGGPRRPFGYDWDWLTVVEPEADQLVEAANDVFAGVTLHTIVKTWNDAGLTTPDGFRWARNDDETRSYVLDDDGERVPETLPGGRWTPTVLRRILCSPRIAGWREHDGAFVAEAEWDAIIDRETVEALRKVFADPTRLQGGSRTRKYLLTTGFLHCGRDTCDRPLYSHPAGTKPGYGCLSAFGGCGRLTILGPPLDDLVVEMFFTRLEKLYRSTRLAARLQRSAADAIAAAGEVDRWERKLNELAAVYGLDAMTTDRYLNQQADAQARLDRALAAQAKVPDGKAIGALLSGREQLRADWDAPTTTLAAKQAALRLILDYVPIHPGTKGRKGFDYSRVGEPVWRI